MPEGNKGHGYALSSTVADTPWLAQQMDWQARQMRHLLEDAGIEAGMKVLDLGCGPGSVALVAGQMIGPTGSVLGIDINPSFLQLARERAREAGLLNLEFIEGDLGDLDKGPDIDSDFDAVVGRLILQYLPNPTKTLQWAVQHMRPGGVVAIEEGHYHQPPVAHPSSAVLSRIFDFVLKGFTTGGADPFLGLKLYRIFIEAGLSPPEMRAWGHVITPDQPASHVLHTLPGSAPRMIAEGLVGADELDLGRLEAEVAQERVEAETLYVMAGRMQAWARKVDARS